MQNVVPALNFNETVVHIANTMAARPPHWHHCDSAILNMLPDLTGLSDVQLRAHVNHFVAAVHVLDKWYVLDSAAPGRMYPLRVDEWLTLLTLTWPSSHLQMGTGQRRRHAQPRGLK